MKVLSLYRLVLLFVVCLFSSCALRYTERPHSTRDALNDSRTKIVLADYGLGQDTIQASLVDIGNSTKVYLWEAKQSRAIVLIQHGILGYALRYVSAYHNMIPRLLAEGFSVCY